MKTMAITIVTGCL